MKNKLMAMTVLVVLLSLTFAACAPTAVEEPVEPVADVEEAVADEEEPAAEVEEPAAEQEEPAAEVEEPTAEQEEPVQEPAENATVGDVPESRSAFLAAFEGLWIMSYPYDPDCAETVTFNSDMTFAIDAGEEHLVGMFGLDEEINESGRATFWLLFTSDNGGADCAGNTRDDSGAGGEAFLAITSPSELQWFRQPSGGEAVIIYNR